MTGQIEFDATSRIEQGEDQKRMSLVNLYELNQSLCAIREQNTGNQTLYMAEVPWDSPSSDPRNRHALIQ